MPIDPTAEADSLVASPQEISPIEQQNRYGMKHKSITDLPPGKFVTNLMVQTPAALTTEQFFDILVYLQTHYDVEAMQTTFAASVPNFGENYRNDIHLSVHLRAEQRSID